MGGIELGLWDYLTFVALIIFAVAAVVVLVVVAGLPGKIAISRNHPDAEAVKMMGWAGLLAVVPWIQAFIWAFKPTDIIDIRRWAAEEREEIAKDIARLRGEEPAVAASDNPPSNTAS
ncbi:MAG: DUF3302 domain-containing protein [Haliea sp.]|nr:DUF3302 domain-containing protein [Haliea sp.]